MKIILASKSGVRKKILKKNKIICEVFPSNVDEDEVKNSLISTGANPLLISKNLAELKANKVSLKKPDKIAQSPLACSSQSITRIVINIFCFGALILCLTNTGNAVQAEIVKEDKSKLRLRGSLRLELDDNVFRLDHAGKSRITTAEERNIASGRLTNMESISDRVISTILEL